jgi:predicted metalloprotease with PDZ domain
VSFYEQGALASFLLDLELRRRTANRVSLDTLMREMYRRFPFSGPGFSTAELVETAAELTGSAFDDFFNRYIAGTESYPFETLAGTVGLKLTRRSGTSEKSYSGVEVHDVNGAVLVRSVSSDGPAYGAGILPGDEVLAVGGRKCLAADFSRRIERMIPGDSVRLDLMRRNRLRRIEFMLTSKPAGCPQLSRLPHPTSAQRSAYEDWLKQPWPESQESD